MTTSEGTPPILYSMRAPLRSLSEIPATLTRRADVIDTQTLRHEILTELEERVPDDTLEQVLERMKLVFALFYDVDDDEPDQAIRDALADLMHVAATQGVNFEQTVNDAARTWSREREEWGLD